MKKCASLIIGILIVWTTSCNQEISTSTEIIHLNYQKAEKIVSPQLSSLLSDIRYVALESSDTCLLKDIQALVLTEKYIVINDGNQCYAFDKTNGKFLHLIGKGNSNDPSGYSRSSSPLFVQGNHVLLVGNGGLTYNVYDLDNGKICEKIPGEYTEEGKWTFERIFPIRDSLILRYPLNIDGKNKIGINVRNYSGEVLKEFPSTNNIDGDSPMNFFIDSREIEFYAYNGYTYFHEITSDTIFRLNDQLEMEPCYVIGLGSQLPTLLNVRNQEKELILCSNFIENDNVLLFKTLWQDRAYLYNKNTKKLGYVNTKETDGFINDLNGFLPFWPIDCGRGKANNEVWASIQPDEYMEGVEATGVNPSGLNLKFDDNPVIAIGILK